MEEPPYIQNVYISKLPNWFYLGGKKLSTPIKVTFISPTEVISRDSSHWTISKVLIT